MMKKGIIKTCLDIVYKDWNGNKTRPNYHYAFAIKKNKILEVGKNQPEYESKNALYLGRIYSIKKWNVYPFLHAESDLISRLDKDYHNNKTEILSLRINRHGRFKLAKPCINCQQLLDKIGITKIAWSCNVEDDSKNSLILGSQNKILLETLEKQTYKEIC